LSLTKSLCQSQPNTLAKIRPGIKTVGMPSTNRIWRVRDLEADLGFALVFALGIKLFYDNLKKGS
jgi:hypothetical protein